MATATLSSLDSRTLARRLGELAGDERRVQVEFLLHLEEFDRRRAHLELGYGSLWAFCLEALHLREGSAGRRIGAMKVLRRFPRLAPALRDGRLCLSTPALLGQVLTEENVEELVARAAFRTTAEVDHLVASLRPRRAPREGIRQLSEPAGTGTLPLREAQTVAASPSPPSSGPGSRDAVETSTAASAGPPLVLEALRSRTAEMRAVSEGQWSLRVTVGRSLKDDLEALAMLLSHKIRKGDLAAVLHEAIRCGIEKHGKRKGAVEPTRKVPKATPPKDTTAVPAELRRQVWARDGGRCAFTGPDGRRCNSRWQVEVDHKETYGPEYMLKYRKGESTDPGGSGRPPPVARETEAVL